MAGLLKGLAKQVQSGVNNVNSALSGEHTELRLEVWRRARPPHTPLSTQASQNSQTPQTAAPAHSPAPTAQDAASKHARALGAGIIS